MFTLTRVEVVAKSPKQSTSGSDFDQAVQTKTDQGYGPRGKAGDHRYEPFSSVVGDCKEFKLLTAADEFRSAVEGRCRHRTIISHR